MATSTRWLRRSPVARCGRRQTCGVLVATMVLLLATACAVDGRRPTAQITPADLPMLVPSAAAVSDILGVALPDSEARWDLGQEFEGVDPAHYGLVSGNTTVYRTVPRGTVAPGGAAPEVGVIITLALYETVAGAAGAFRELLARLDQETATLAQLGQDVGERFDIDAPADEAVGLRSVPSAGNADHTTGVILRVDQVVGPSWVLRSDDADMRPAVGDLAAQMTATVRTVTQR